MTHPFAQVDVFGTHGLDGNPVAVVHCGEGCHDDADLAAFARWTNLSETTFLLPPTQPGADYRLRIFTPEVELAFAGHPTLGSAWTWLQAGGVPARPGVLVQECGVGLVDVRVAGDGRLAFAAPPLRRPGPVEEESLRQAVVSIGLDPARLVDAAWVGNGGPEWLGLLLDSAETVLALRPDFAALTEAGLEVGVVAPHAPGGPADVEVRAFCPGSVVPEDPVTGSLNAGLAVWLVDSGRLAPPYRARQGTVLRCNGSVDVEADDDGTLWVGGACRTVVSGTVTL